MNKYADENCEFCAGTGEHVKYDGDTCTCQCVIKNKKEKAGEDYSEMERGN